MDLADEAVRADLRGHLGGLLRGRRVIAGLMPLAGFRDIVTMLQEAGGARPLLLASSRGAGPVPSADEAEVLMLDVPPASSMTEEVRRHDRLLRTLPAHARAAVDAFDPDRTAVWLVDPFVHNDPILGRRVLTGRPAAWAALEDKTSVAALWTAVGARQARSAVTAVDADALRTASETLDRGDGVVWSGDARDGLTGGGDYVRRVGPGPRREEEAAAALDFFGPRCDRVRVMPFLEGVPCSIHGMVLPTGTAVLRPLELAVLRGPGRRFVYGGLGTTWDPPGPDRAEMRDLARRTGEHLHAAVGYRGGFGIDGVLTADGFVPTELNPRFTGGLNALARATDPSLFALLQTTLLAGSDPGVHAEDLERWAVATLDAHRFAKPIGVHPQGSVGEAVDLPVAWRGGALVRLDEDDVDGGPDDGTGWRVVAGDNPAGTFARLDTAGPAGLAGVRCADLNVALLAFLEAELGLRFGEVTTAPDVRSSRR